MTQTGVLQSAWRYRLLVALIIIAFAVGATVLSASRSAAFVANATVVLEDPSRSNVLSLDSDESARRAIASQLEVFRSSLVTSRAAEIATNEGIDVSEADIATYATFLAVPGTDVITVSYTDSTPERATAVANSIIAAYDEVQNEQSRDANSAILERLDVTERLLDTNLRDVRIQIDAILAARDTEGQIEATLNRLSSVQAQLLEATDPDLRASLTDELGELRQQMEALRLASEIESESSQLAPLLARQARLQAQLAVVDQRRTEQQLESAIAGSGIAFSSPAFVTEFASGAGRLFTVLGGVLLGGLVALGLAYALSNRRREFLDSSEPETVIAAPFLAEIPRWSGTGKSALPVRDDPRSPTAEAFRFAYASLAIRSTKSRYKSVSFVSSQVGEGKSTLVANTALAAARTGKRVMLIDADFGSQSSSRLLVEGWARPGLTDLVSGDVPLESAFSPVTVAEGGGTLHVMGRGNQVVTAPDFFANPMVEEILSSLEETYDLVLVDGPPLLQVAYASSIAQIVDSLVLVIPHGSHIREAEGLARRVQLIDTPVLGYIYNKAPQQSGRQPLGGSMQDVLGDQEIAVPTSANPSR